MPQFKRYLVSGLLTLVPLWVTWLLFEFIFRQLSKFGTPVVRTFARRIEADWPSVSRWLVESWFQDVLAVLVVIAALYLLGWAVTRVLGRRIVHAFESLLERVPLITNVYSSVKKLISVLQQKPTGVQRVVLIEFPSKDLKAVGLVTRTLKDPETGEDLAAVYVPTTPNPTSGYLEIVPLDRLVSTEWSLDEAMNFLISGGAVGPDKVQYRAGPRRAEDATAEQDITDSG
ncbi:MAG: DUF502 domain-containing protein [Pseudomonadota bacterium]